MRKFLKQFVKAITLLMCFVFLIGCENQELLQKQKDPNENVQPKAINVEPTPTSTNIQKVEIPEKKKEFRTVKARAVYLTGWAAGTDAKLQHILDLATTTEINAVVLDIKDDDGKVGYETSVKDVRNIGAWEKKYDVESVIKKLHEKNIYVIGRLVCFKDPILPNKRPDLAYKSIDGGIWRDKLGRAWVNPLNKNSWEYILNIAKEAADKGFDEIQYDYIRFPNGGDGGNVKTIDYGANFVSASKSDIIAEFLQKSMKEIHEGKGIPLSADLFAIAAVGTGDDNALGQNWEKLSSEIDYLCPMVYPSHYAAGQEINGKKFLKPDFAPYDVVYQTLKIGKERLDKVEKKAKIRPYLQAFNATWLGNGNWQKYGAQQVREQIKAVYDAGNEEWILWDPSNNYPETYFEKKK